MEKTMPDPTPDPLPGQTPAPAPEKPQEQQPTVAAAQPPAEPAEEPFDKDRAMSTIKNLREQEKAWKKERNELDQLRAEKQTRAEAEMTAAEKLQKQADAMAAENAALKADLLRRDVIAETGLPSELADRLKGTTKEELVADANILLALLPQPIAGKNPAPKISPTNPNNGQLTESEAQKRERLFGKQGNPFDIDTIKAQGGGVVWNK
jgi:hypothetical protein